MRVVWFSVSNNMVDKVEAALPKEVRLLQIQEGKWPDTKDFLVESDLFPESDEVVQVSPVLVDNRDEGTMTWEWRRQGYPAMLARMRQNDGNTGAG